MLREVHIRNFAIIEDEEVSFAPGLNVISGETGAGKSIVLQALELILGGRPKPHYIRAGSDGWEIEALFDLSALDERLRNNLPDIAQAQELVLMRSMNSAGKGRVYINGRLATVSLLEEIAGRLINICGQGQQIRLLEPQYHLELLDDYGGTGASLEEYRQAYVLWQQTVRRLTELEERERRSVLRRAELEHLVEELGAVELQAGLREELEQRVRRMGNAEALIQAGRDISSMLNAEGAIYEQFSALARNIGEFKKLDDAFEPIAELFEAAEVNLQEFERRLDDYAASIEIDEQELGKLRDHLAEIARLERKYRCSDQGLVELYVQAQAELADLGDGDSLERLRTQAKEQRTAAAALAAELSGKRKKHAAKLTAEVGSELGELNMPGARLEAAFEACELYPGGVDKLELLIAANKGEPCKPLRQVASGGELSRMMLVLKKVLRERSGVNVLVFDEVDTGISGGVARAVGEKLKALAARSQVICITHLAQVASLADHHLLVEKVVGERTTARIRSIGAEEKVDEIARMLAGYRITNATRESARELLSYPHKCT